MYAVIEIWGNAYKVLNVDYDPSKNDYFHVSFEDDDGDFYTVFHRNHVKDYRKSGSLYYADLHDALVWYEF